MRNNISKNYTTWLTHAAGDAELVRELRAMEGDENAIYEAFYRELEFGTSGLRGLIGAGTNRINIYTVARASQGLANYILSLNKGADKCVAVSYDSRVKSDIFANTAAGVFAANGIKAFIYPEIMPVPCLSYAVRELGCAAGVMITASHNPASYNGYKVYNSDGCQITTEMAAAIFDEIEKVDVFGDVKSMDFREGMVDGRIEYIDGSVFESYIKNVLAQSLDFETFAKKTNQGRLPARPDLKPTESVSCANEELISGTFRKDIKIVYSPLHGSGYVPVTKALKRAGYDNVLIVEEQKAPDGSFPTCTAPNPENREAMRYGIRLAEETAADIVLATDPDCDRVGVAIRCPKDGDGAETVNNENTIYEYRHLTGNEVGILLLDYICSRSEALGTMPANPLFCKTIVTSDLSETVAASYGVETKNVLTGFKFIGEQIGFLEDKGEENRFIFGFEESYGYLAGTHVRDKDGVVASLLICEMADYYKSLDKTLFDRLNEIYEKHGYFINSTHSFDFPGATGFEKMKGIMAELRRAGDEPVYRVNNDIFKGSDNYTGGLRIVDKIDYMDGVCDLPKADVIKLIFSDGSSIIIRPSGTEPKIKVYISVKASSLEEAEKQKDSILSRVKAFVQKPELYFLLH